MTTVSLHGPLAEAYQPEFSLEVYSVAEAIRCLSTNLTGFREMIGSSDFKILVDNEAVSESDLVSGHLITPSHISLVPVVSGSKGGGGKIVAGLSLLAIAYFAPAAFGGASGLIAGGGGAAIAQSAAMNIGISMAITGVAEVLTKAPKASEVDEVERSESFLMNGPKNVSAQGRAIPVGYGRLRIGSRIISAGVETMDY